MATIIIMPRLGLTMIEGTIIRWLKKEGDKVEAGEPIIEINSDKSNVEVEAKESGVLRKILVPEGSTVPILTKIGVIGTEDETIPDFNEEKDPEQKPDNKTKDTSDIKVSPKARRLAKELDVDINKIYATGNYCIIGEKEVREFVEKRQKTTPLARKLAEENGVNIDKISKGNERITKEHVLAFAAQKCDEDNAMPCLGMRKVIAERMTLSKTTIPHAYISLDVDISKLLKLRNDLNEVVEKDYGVKLSLNDLLIKVTAVVLSRNELVNSNFLNDKIILKRNVNIGLAVSVENGLIVPVVQNADKKTIIEIARNTKYLIEKARNGNLVSEDYQGGSFTISNLGMYEIDHIIPVINPPETAILGLGRIVKKPVIIDDEIVIKPIINITLSFDHRVIDGAAGAKFLREIKHLMESPWELLVV